MPALGSTPTGPWPEVRSSSRPLSGKALAVGEGIENVLSAVKLEITGPPAWAATVANNLSSVPVIPGVERLFILADNDAHSKGQETRQDPAEEVA